MLWLAVESGNAPAAAALLRAGAPPNARKETDNWEYILHEAVRRSGELVSVLLNAGAFPDVADDTGMTPLHVAVRWGRIGAVSALPEAGANPRAPDDRGETPIDLSQRDDDDAGSLVTSRRHRPPRPPPCRDCKDDLLPMLLAPPPAPPRCGSLCEPEFWESASSEQVKNALARAPAEARWPASAGGPLHLALAAGADLEVVELLLHHGVDPNGRNLEDDTPLHVAARTPGSTEALALLLQRGATISALNLRDWTPLHEASESPATLDAMLMLLEAGADPGARAGDTLGVTPRQLAVSQPEGSEAAAMILNYGGTDEMSGGAFRASPLLFSVATTGHPETVELLLELGADAAGKNAFGDTPIHYAARTGNVEAMRVLLNHGADPNDSKYDRPAIVSGEGERPLHLAVRHPEAVALLLEAGADPNGRVPVTGETPLHRAASICSGESLALLLVDGAKPNVRDGDGWTPLHKAVLRLRNSTYSDSAAQTYLTACEEDERNKKLGWEKCRTLNAQHFEDTFEPREECEANIVTLILFGADPSIATDVHMGHSDCEGLTALDIARKHELGDVVIGVLESALARGNR